MNNNQSAPKYMLSLWSDRGEKISSTSMDALDGDIVFPTFTGDTKNIVAVRTKFVEIDTDPRISVSYLVNMREAATKTQD